MQMYIDNKGKVYCSNHIPRGLKMFEHLHPLSVKDLKETVYECCSCKCKDKSTTSNTSCSQTQQINNTEVKPVTLKENVKINEEDKPEEGLNSSIPLDQQTSEEPIETSETTKTEEEKTTPEAPADENPVVPPPEDTSVIEEKMPDENLNEYLKAHLNVQIGNEYFSALFYKTLAGFCFAKNLRGFSHWLMKQAKEEESHGDKIYDYILDNNWTLNIPAIEKPECECENLVDVFTLVVEHEKKIAEDFKHLYKMALNEEDFTTQAFLQWFLLEQVEEISNSQEILDKLIAAGDNYSAVLLIDQFASQRS